MPNTTGFRSKSMKCGSPRGDDPLTSRRRVEAKEEPAHIIIRECEAFWQERLEEFNNLEWQSETNWTVDQMIRFLNKARVKNLEEEESD